MCANVVHAGAPFIGELGETKSDCVEKEYVTSLRNKISSSNRKLVSSLCESDHSKELLRQAQLDAEKGRMSMPLLVEDAGHLDYLLAPRFGVAQWRTDGTVKLRPIDHFSWSKDGRGKRKQQLTSVNGAANTADTVKHDTLDDMARAMRVFRDMVKAEPGLYKADIDSAYRRVPIRPQDRWASGVAFKANEGVRQQFHVIPTRSQS